MVSELITLPVERGELVVVVDVLLDAAPVACT
jgi:hypothetical protein